MERLLAEGKGLYIPGHVASQHVDGQWEGGGHRTEQEPRMICSPCRETHTLMWTAAALAPSGLSWTTISPSFCRACHLSGCKGWWPTFLVGVAFVGNLIWKSVLPCSLFPDRVVGFFVLFWFFNCQACELIMYHVCYHS